MMMCFPMRSQCSVSKISCAEVTVVTISIHERSRDQFTLMGSQLQQILEITISYQAVLNL